MSKLKTYRVPFAYERYGYITVEADTIMDAYDKAIDKLDKMTVYEMEENSEYLDLSEEIDIDGITSVKNEDIVKE